MEGKVKVLALSHKNGKTVLKAGDKVTDNDVNNFDELVEKGYIQVAKKGAPKKAESKKEDNK